LPPFNLPVKVDSIIVCAAAESVRPMTTAATTKRGIALVEIYDQNR
jgi:hypothetical protein